MRSSKGTTYALAPGLNAHNATPATNGRPLGIAGDPVVKDADDGGVAALKHADNAALAAAIGLGRLDFNQYLIALHGAVDLVGRNEDIFTPERLAGIGADKAEAVAMEIEPAGR